MREHIPPDEDRTVDDQGREFIARRHVFPASGGGFLLAPIVWFVYFLVVYGLQGAGCAGPGGGSLLGTETVRLTLAAVTLVTMSVIAVSGVWSYRAWRRLLRELEEQEGQAYGQSAFLAYGALLHAGLFLIATLWIGFPILFVDPCSALTFAPS